MCTRFARMSLIAALMKAFDFEAEMELEPKYNLAPTDKGDVLIHRDNKRVLRQMMFGLVPHWAKDPKIALHCLNARAETVAEKPAFRNSFRRKRCLVLTDGFFEWRREGKTKTPFFFFLKSKEPFAFAGLWDAWVQPDGKEVESFAIVTTEPNDFLKPIHNRMPVILSKENESRWLSPATDPDTLTSLLKPFPSDQMDSYQVSTYMNNSRNKDKTCVSSVSSLEFGQG